MADCGSLRVRDAPRTRGAYVAQDSPFLDSVDRRAQPPSLREPQLQGLGQERSLPADLFAHSSLLSLDPQRIREKLSLLPKFH